MKKLDAGAAVPKVAADVVVLGLRRLPPRDGAAVPEAGALLVVCRAAAAGVLLVDAEANMLENAEAAVVVGWTVLVVTFEKKEDGAAVVVAG